MRPRGSVGEVMGVIQQIIKTNGPCRLPELRERAVAKGVSPSAVKWSVANGFRLGLLVATPVAPASASHARGRFIDVAKRVDTFSCRGSSATFDLTSLWSQPVSHQGGLQ